MNRLKIVQDINTFGDNVVVDKTILLLSSFFVWLSNQVLGLFTFFSAHQLLSAFLGMVFLDTTLGVVIAFSKGEFSFKALVSKTFWKLSEYGFYCSVILLVGLAPTKAIVTPLVSLLFTYILLRESTSLIKKSSKFFQNSYMSDVSSHLEALAGRLLGKFKMKK